MDVLKFLKCIRSKRFELADLKEQRDEIYYSLMPSGIRYDLDKVQTSPTDRMPAVAGDLAEVQTIIDQRIERLSNDILLANRIIDKMPTAECRQLLMLRYLSGKRRPLSWNDIADKMDYSVDHVQGKLHRKAINEARAVWRKENGGQIS